MSYEITEGTTAEMLIYTVSVTDPTNDTVTCSLTKPTTMFYLLAGTKDFGMFKKIENQQLYNGWPHFIHTEYILSGAVVKNAS